LKRRRPLAGVLAVATFVLAGVGFGFRHHLFGVMLVVLAVPVAVLAWIALGAPINRRALRDK
jgi:Na+/pantothenate symporter